MKHSSLRHSARLLTALCLSTSALATPPGDIRIEASGTVLNTSPNPLGPPLTGVTVGDPVTIVVEVFDAPIVSSGHTLEYPIDPAASSATIGAYRFVPGPSQVQPTVTVVDSVQDVLEFGFVVDSPQIFNIPPGMVDTSGQMFGTTDLNQLGGTYTAGGSIVTACLIGSFFGNPFLVSVDLTEVRIHAGGINCTSVGSNYCTAAANSTGVPATISACGSDLVADNDLTLVASSMPDTTVGYFLVSRATGFVANPAGSSGNLCLGGTIGRMLNPVEISVGGEFARRVNLQAIPMPNDIVHVVPGERWYFQAWFRDSVAGSATSNLTDGLGIQFH